ncbi:hypothetical protein B0H13DRAFT_1871061 [Mycena leptocephala]|nr:hypothetical protein B0H13DRAFT_1871061 [Mycena leptocephala]
MLAHTVSRTLIQWPVSLQAPIAHSVEYLGVVEELRPNYKIRLGTSLLVPNTNDFVCGPQNSRYLLHGFFGNAAREIVPDSGAARPRTSLTPFSVLDSDDENTPTDPIDQLPPTNKKTLKAQLIEKEARITELEGIISHLEADARRLQDSLDSVQITYKTLLENYTTISIANKSLKSLKRKSDSSHREELAKRQKRIKRLERERDVRADSNLATAENLQAIINHNSTRAETVK